MGAGVTGWALGRMGMCPPWKLFEWALPTLFGNSLVEDCPTWIFSKTVL